MLCLYLRAHLQPIAGKHNGREPHLHGFTEQDACQREWSVQIGLKTLEIHSFGHDGWHLKKSVPNSGKELR
jgi:hypothetical protein